MFRNELLQLLDIPLGLGKSPLREIHWVARHWDAHIVALAILQGKRKVGAKSDKAK